MFLGAGMAGADELTDLKQQLEQLQKKIEELEKKQEAQAKSVDKIKKQPSARQVVSDALGKQATIGGHFKFFLADQTTGERNDLSQHNSFSAGINDLWLYFSKGLTDWMQIILAFNSGSLQTTGNYYIDNVQLIPEPATMMLLGLGGVVLLRKKIA